MNKHKVTHHQNSDIKTANRDHNRTTAFEWPVMSYWGGLKLVLRAQPDVVQTFSWLFRSHDHPLTRQRIFTVNR